MRYIVEVGLKNFQSHKDSVINFEQGFNVLVGASDSGKTAIKRGIEAVLYNKHVSDEFIMEGEKNFSNYVLFNDGLRITREKGGRGLNRYLIEYPGGEEVELNNFGVKVPQEVLDAHGMHLVELGKEVDSLNCAHQLAGPFFLQNTPGERAAIIGSIAKTQVIDEAVSDTMSKHREQKKELKSLQATNKTLEKGLAAYETWIGEARELMDELDKDYTELTQYAQKLNKLGSTMNALENNVIKAAMQRNIMEVYDDIEIQEAKLMDVISRFNKVMSLENKLNRVEADRARKADLETIANTYLGLDEVSEETDKIQAMLSKYNGISKKVSDIEASIAKRRELEVIVSSYSDTDSILQAVEILEKDIARYNNLARKVESLSGLITRKQKGEEVIKSLNNSLNESLNRYQTALQTLGKCPVCYSIITEEQFSNIKENLA